MTLKENVLTFICRKSEKSESPFYVYDSELIREHCRMFLNIPYPNKAIHFASMANTNPSFLNIIKSEKIGVFVNSADHLKLMQENGFANSEIIFTASAMNEYIMKSLHGSGVQVNLDSPGQLRQWISMNHGSKAGIRCNIGASVTPKYTHAGYFIGNESRLGFTIEELRNIPDKSMIDGLHIYVGTDILDINYFMECYEQFTSIAVLFPNLSYLNLGGGFGVEENGDHEFDIVEYGKRVSALMEKVSQQQHKPIKLILEPGRIIGGNAGFFVCRVTDIKTRDKQRFVGVNGSSVQFPRPLYYPETARHPVLVIHNDSIVWEGEKTTTTVYGCSTYSRDFLRRDAELGNIEIGDLLVLGNAGSYSASSYTSFLGFPKPEEYFV